MRSGPSAAFILWQLELTSVSASWGHRCAERKSPREREWSNLGAESASSEKLPRGRDLPLQPSSAMGLQLADLHAFDVTAVR